METNELAHNWPEKKEKLKKEFPQLTEEDLIYEIGKEQELLERLQQRMNKTKEEIRKWLHIMG